MSKYLNSVKRNEAIDSIKGALIVLVVLGHCLSLGDKDSTMFLHNLIYSFHMPLFVFLSGYFTKKNERLVTGIKSLFETFISFHILYMLFTRAIPSSITQVLTPMWIYWYLLSLVFWRLVVNFLPFEKWNKVVVISLSLFFALLVGYVDFVGYPLSLSRTIVFFPFFILGFYLQGVDFVKLLHYNEYLSKLTYGGVILFILTIMMHLPDFAKIFAGSFSYSLQNIYIVSPFISRLIFFILAISISILFIRFVPSAKILSNVGRNTILIYVYHSFFVYVGRIVSLHLGISIWPIFYICIYSVFICFIIYIFRNLKLHQYFLHPLTSFFK